MNAFDLLVRSEQDIGISDGKIVSLGKNLAGSADAEIDATGLTVFPGVIDSHVHFNEPGRTDWEGFATGSRAAAAGGTTTIFDMPLNAHPPTIDGDAFDAKRAAAEKHSLVDFGLWGGLVPGNVDQLETLRDRGVVGIKAFMCDSGIDDFPAVDRAALRAGMIRAAELGLLVAVHAESNESLQNQPKSGSVRDYLDSRPMQVELAAIKTAIELAHEVGCRLHIVHVSCGRGVALVKYARSLGADVTCETCPHYLLLTDEDMVRLGAVAKCAPPLRSASEQADLWRQVPDITTIGSDHSPSPWPMKEAPNFFQAWGGISGCQHLLPLLIEAKMSEDEIARLTSAGVAERFRIREKGGIAIGRDADLTLVDLRTDQIVRAESLHYRHRHSPYVGRKLRNRIVRTILRGQTIFANGRFSPLPHGRLVRPDYSLM
ncbi:MAG: allantoinase AllB [Verrucomicrobiota bacterium]|nr:allantoinase AllB [Verrucomicrobiota bacterium]